MDIQDLKTDWFVVEPADPPNQGMIFVNHETNGRSGHLGHALVEYAPGKILAFYPNCSDANDGHNGDGWMEYKRSEDGGHTWSEPQTLDYSKQRYDSDRRRSVLCEKAVRTDDGAILLFNFECENIPERQFQWQPIGIPTILRSTDGGNSWETARPMGDEPGRIWDVIVHNGTIFVLELYNDKKHGNHNLPRHHYSLYESTDDGRTFRRRSILPFEVPGRLYGTMAILADGSLIAYIYNIADEKHLEYVISQDGGETWSEVRTAYFAKQIRNPQMTAFKNGYILHGRSGSMGQDEVKGHFVLYTSGDGIHWDEGRYLQMQTAGNGAYSNNLLVRDTPSGVPNRLLIQASHAYDAGKTNVMHWWLK